MNVRFSVADLLTAEEIGPDYLKPAPRPQSWLDVRRLASIAVTIVMHVIVVAAIAYGGVRVAHVMTPKTVTVSIAEAKPETPQPLVPPPRMEQPQVETIAPPDVVIAKTTPPQTITVETKETPVVRQDPQPVAPETQASYLGRVLAHLNAFKRYPAEARRAKVQGVVMLHFVMAKDGKVVTFDLAKSSGRPALDSEALALIQRAQPLPPLPAGYGKDELNAVVPIEFSLH